MKSMFNFVGKLFAKGVALFALVGLWICTSALKIFTFVYQFAAWALGLAGIALVVYDLIVGPITMKTAATFAVTAVIIALKFLLPVIIPVLDKAQHALVEFVTVPSKVKSPVRYTV